MTLKLLAVGDMHLGRRPSRLPEALAGRARELGPAGAWQRVVELAIEEGVDAVALAGDVVEREDDFYEGYRELQAGVSRLREAGIQVLGVAGNHDVRVLPRLADQLDDFRLLGRGGEWEAAEISAGGESLTVWGWSFAREQVRESPVAGMGLDRRPGLNIGLLHCDRDQPGSAYAPVTSAELRAAGLDGWLLGHIHAPDTLSADSPSGYLGSVTGMDPGEPGAHGPWLLSVDRGRLTAVEQQVLAPLRWESLALDLTGLAEAEDARGRLLDRVRALDAALADAARRPEAVGLRVTLTGRCGFGSRVADLFGEAEREHLPAGESGVHYFLERLRVATRPETDLETLAEQTDPPGLLARRLLLLDRPASDPARRALLEEARRSLDGRWREQRWQDLADGPLDDDVAADWLRRAGTRLLERMLDQREGAG